MGTINKIFENEISKLLQNKLKNMNINILIVGATGVGKSSTVNVLFDTDKVPMGHGFTPQTKFIESYSLENLTIWDTPGLGDGENDKEYANSIKKKLNEEDKNGRYLIDLVLVVIDGSYRDLGTAYNLLENIIMPTIKDENRILVAVNKIDKLGSKFWDSDKNTPTDTGKELLEDTSNKIQERIRKKTEIKIKKPICYSTGILDEDTRKAPYNLAKLLLEIINTTPEEKRLIIFENLNKEQNWKNNDKEQDYEKSIVDSFLASFKKIIDFVTDKENLKFFNNIMSFFK